ncbi:phosphoglycerate mutase family protein [soil metagenome]
MYLIRIALVFFLFFLIGCTESNTIYLVRHAEKDTGKNPSLTKIGKQRAEDLMNLLKDKNITGIYSTDYKRTIETAEALSKLTNVAVQLYSVDTTTLFIKKIFSSDGNNLVVGHSNTILSFLDSAGIQHKKKNISDNEYDNIFIIKIKNGKATELSEEKYGEITLADSSVMRMR